MPKHRTLSYWGGKGKPMIHNWIIQHLPSDTHCTYVEPFAGMCSILLGRSQCSIEIINDLDANVATWWTVIRDNPEELSYYINNTPHCRMTFHQAYEGLDKGVFDDAPIMRAWAVYVVLQHGITHSFKKNAYAPTYTMSHRLYNERFTQHIPKLSKRMANVQIQNRTATAVLQDTQDIENVLVYCDPPYHGKNKITGRQTTVDKYNHPEIDLDLMTDLLQSQRGKVAISGYAGAWDHLGWKCYTLEATVVTGGGGKREKEGLPRTESLWVNYQGEQQMALNF